MGKRQIPENFASKLLEQDKSLHSERYKEHRMQLEHQLIQVEYRKRLTIRVVGGALLVAVAAGSIAASHVFGGPDPWDNDATVFSIAAGGLYFVACAVFLIGMASYFSRFTPQVRRVREELRDESIRELRREVAELRQIVEVNSKAHKAEQSGSE